MQEKKTIRFYFIENICDNDDLIGHVHHGRFSIRIELRKTRTADARVLFPELRKDNWLEQIQPKEKEEEEEHKKSKDTNVARGLKSNCY